MTLMSIFPLMGLASGLGTALLLFAGGVATANPASGVTAGDWYLYMQAVGFYWWPMMNIASFWSQFQDGLSAAERVFALIDAEPKVHQTASERGRETRRPYPVLEHHASAIPTRKSSCPISSLDIKAGETLALVGHTGAGKSSIAKLVTRFYEFQGGQILIDERDIRTLDLGQYRLQTGLVPQDPFLFSGTVGENIRYGCPDRQR